ncbi:MAG: hypothetical protein GX424_01875 [Clostridiales bacterium]|nr:hypothetical protein [Clostridiales bacterium]
MKEGFVEKSARLPGAEDMEQINRYTRREFTADEVYTFSVVLCDNEIDRDGERFTADALSRLAKLFPGKTGIFNHSMQAQNQTARIYACGVEEDRARKTQCGDTYRRLVAKAYLPRSEKNGDLILELESGIKKEVSVGCAVAKVTCSVCGADLKKEGCAHVRGERYGGKICCAELSEPTDAYEWSFVAVPAQREAGVIKSYAPGLPDAAAVEKELSRCEGEITLTKAQAETLSALLKQREREAECGRAYRAQLEASLARSSGIFQPDIPQETVRRMAASLSLADLRCVERSCRKKAEEVLPLHPQLASEESAARRESNAQFQI